MGNLLLLGADHGSYNEVRIGRASDQTVAGISAGSDPESPSLQFKGDADIRNEDALCVVDTGDLVAMAVADAHYGHESSHRLIEGIHACFQSAPARNAIELVEAVWGLGDGAPPLTTSETTLLIAVYDRTTGKGFGTGFGDSTLAVVSSAGHYRSINEKDSTYVAAEPLSLDMGGEPFTFAANTGDLLLMYTDGIDECHYRHPKSSVRPHHIEDMCRTHPRPDDLVPQLMDLALAGVDGNPGGQDNIALVASVA